MIGWTIYGVSVAAVWWVMLWFMLEDQKRWLREGKWTIVLATLVVSAFWPIWTAVFLWEDRKK